MRLGLFHKRDLNVAQVGIKLLAGIDLWPQIKKRLHVEEWHGSMRHRESGGGDIRNKTRHASRIRREASAKKKKVSIPRANP